MTDDSLQTKTAPAPATPPRIDLNPLLTGLYVVVALVFAASAGYMLFVQKRAVAEPQVLFPALGAIWFSVRAALALRGRSGGSDARG